MRDHQVQDKVKVTQIRVARDQHVACEEGTEGGWEEAIRRSTAKERKERRKEGEEGVKRKEGWGKRRQQEREMHQTEMEMEEVSRK